MAVSMAFRCFFRLLFKGSLPADAVEYLPEEAIPAALPAGEPEAEAKEEPAAVEPARAKPAEKKPAARKPSSAVAEHHIDGALALLALLQREGRLVDFLRETVEDYSDEDIGAAVRDIHRGCKAVLDEHLSIEAVMPGEEDSPVTVPEGFDPSEVRLVGKVSGEPPFRGTMRHHGWRVTETRLPQLTEGVDRRVLAPAEVELGSQG